MSEAELYVMRARLQGGLLNKARRGALKLVLPIGFCYTPDERVVLDPHAQVQLSIRQLFAAFATTGSACGVVRHFRQHGLTFPRRLRRGAHQGELVWNEVRHEDVLRLLHHPAYAGAYVFGRTQTWKTADGRTHIRAVPRDDWPVLVSDAHVGYITWQDYERNQEQLAMNSQAYAPKRFAPPREGPALLQGLVLCARCGERMTVRYHQRAGKRAVPDYLCQRRGIASGQPPCQRVPGAALDQAIGELLLQEVTPHAIALTLAMQEEVIQHAEQARRLRHLQVERARYEAELAQRRYLRVDPDNRLVAQVLEAEWNAKLRELEEARQSEERDGCTDAYQIAAEERAELEQVPSQFAQFWTAPQTTARERKRVVRFLIDDVTVAKTEQIVAHVRFKGGVTRTLTVPLPPPFAHSRLTPPQTLAAIDRLLNDLTDARVAQELNRCGYRTFVGLPFTASHVYQLRRHHGLLDRYTRLRAQGLCTAEELAQELGVAVQTIWHWYHLGRIVGARYNDRGSCLFHVPTTP